MQDRKKEDQKESGWKLKDHGRSYNKAKHSCTRCSKVTAHSITLRKTWQTPCSHRASKSKHLKITKVVSARETLYYTVLHYFTADNAIAPARWSFKIHSCIFLSSIFSAPSNKSNVTLTLNFFSCTKITYASVFWGKWTG